MKKILGFVKSEAVLTAALLLAVISAFIVPPDAEYIGYIDLSTLSVLFCLMAVMAGLREIGVFEVLAQKLLSGVGSMRSMLFTLWMLCFFGSMLITNDVALITFVPFTLILLDMMGEQARAKWIVPTVVMQTIAANLGSMLTPIGNPQNLYLYARSGAGIGDFLLTMLPYTLLSAALLVIWTLVLCRNDKTRPQVSFKEKKRISDVRKAICYAALFLISLLTVAHILPYYIPLAAVLLFLLIFDRRILPKPDYSLLLTFIGFFIFIGNMQRIPEFRGLIGGVTAGNETIAAILSSQVISNVPAALLLSGFTENYRALLIGVNLGGLGTLIASMASLISYKYIARGAKALKGRYFAVFTVSNIIFLAALLIMYFICP